MTLPENPWQNGTNHTTGKWLWPKENGFSLDIEEKPVLGNIIVEVGTKVDRFGRENGTFVSAADAPYDQRSLPSSSLNTALDRLIHTATTSILWQNL